MFRSILYTATAVAALLAVSATTVADDNLFTFIEAEDSSDWATSIVVHHPGVIMDIEVSDDEIDVEAYSIDGNLHQDESADFPDEMFRLSVIGSDGSDSISIHFEEELDEEVHVSVYVEAGSGDDEVTVTSDEDQFPGWITMSLLGQNGDDSLINETMFNSILIGGLGTDLLQGGLSFDFLCGEELLWDIEEPYFLLDDANDLMSDAGGSVQFMQIVMPVIDHREFVYADSSSGSRNRRGTTSSRALTVLNKPLSVAKKPVAIKTHYRWEKADWNTMLSPIGSESITMTYFAEIDTSTDFAGQGQLVVETVETSDESNWDEDAPDLPPTVTSL